MNKLILLLFFLNISFNVYAGPYDAVNQYSAGKVELAYQTSKNRLKIAEKSGDQKAIWNALINLAWLENETGKFTDSIHHSNRALDIAKQSKNPFMQGRSLTWLAWAYSSQGLYKLALQLYSEALKLAAPDGEIAIIPVWGLAKQETGAIYFKMGDIKTAREHLEKTINFAREHSIEIGVAEGGAHLAEIALVQRNLNEAKALAGEAIAAARKCGCSPNNISRAKTVLAKVNLEEAKFDQSKLSKAIESIKSALSYAEDKENIRYIAENKILLANTYPKQKLFEKKQLLDEAIKLLQKSNYETRGTAEAELGIAYKEKDQHLSKFYLDRGYAINKELFRAIDQAYVKAHIGDLALVQGDDKGYIQQALANIEQVSTLDTPDLLSRQMEALAFKLYESKHYSLALEWAQKASDKVYLMLEKDNPEGVVTELKERELDLMDLIADCLMQLQQEDGREHIH